MCLKTHTYGLVLYDYAQDTSMSTNAVAHCSDVFSCFIAAAAVL